MNTLTRYEPLRNLRRELERFFDELTNADEAPSAWAPRLDFTETDDAFVMRMDLPGMTADDVEVLIEDDRLVMRGERTREEREEREDYHRAERSYGAFFRALPLPRTADRDDVQAAFDTGVLTVTIGKSEASQPRRIEVGAGKRLVSAN